MANCKDCVHVDVCCSYLSTAYNKCKLATPDFELLKNIECDECQHYKDRSRFVELPCKVGDLIYIIKKTRGFSVRGAKVSSITITESGKIQVSCYRSSFIGFWDDDAFATKEEAEQALKERKNDELPFCGRLRQVRRRNR